MPRASPSSAGEPEVPACLEILGLRPPLTAEDVKQAYLATAVTAPPDRGGRAEQFVLLQRAFEEANDYVKFKASKLEWLASKVEAYAEQQEVADAAIERGGAIEMEETDWLRKSFGDDFGHVADKLVAVRLRGPQADDVFAVLLGFRAESLKDLALLDLAGGTITDEGLVQLKGLKGLRHLDLRGSAVGRLAAEVPSWFEKLEFLGLPKGGVGLFGRLAMPRRLRLELGDAPTP
ncbi:MAG: J domain-containing protein [Planctomycetia bacterium]